MSKKKKNTMRNTFNMYIAKLSKTFIPEQEPVLEKNMKDLFRKRWKKSGYPDSKDPDLLAVKLSIEVLPQRNWTLISAAEIWINYHEKYCCKKVSIEQSLNTSKILTYEEFEEQISDNCKKLTAMFPDCVNLLPAMYTSTDHRKFARMFSTVSDHMREDIVHVDNGLSFADVVQQVSSRISEDDADRAEFLKKIIDDKIRTLGTLPDGAIIADPVKCTVRIKNSGNHTISLEAALSANFPEMPSPTYSDFIRKELDLFEPFFYKGDAAPAEIENSIKEASKKAISEFLESFPICRLPFESLPDTLVGIMPEDGIWYGKVHAVCSGFDPFYDSGICYYVAKDEIQFSTQYSRSSEWSAMSLKEILKSDVEPVKLGSKKGIPQNIVAFNKLCEAAGKLYETFSDKRIKRMPKLEFRLFDGKIHCRWEYESIPVNWLFDNGAPSDKTIRKRLMDLFQEVADSEVAWQDRAANQAKALSGLNPSEFAALRLIVELRECWYTEINNRLESSVLTTKVSMGPYLDHLCKLKLKNGNEETSLLTFDWRSSRKHGDFRMYKSPVKWAEGVFDMAKPRSFTLEEMDDMTADGREKFFQMSLKQASNDSASKWQVLNILERMSKQYAAEFAKTEEGDKFLRSFEGDDALYVRFFLESLPGCKRLAAKMFPDNE